MPYSVDRNSLLPWIMALPPAHAESGDPALPDDLLVKDFVADLVIALASVEDDHITLLRRRDLAESADVDELYRTAIKNMTERVEFMFTGTMYGGYGILAGGDHEATALCLDFIWDFCSREIGRDLVVAVPARDCLFMAAADDADQVEAMNTLCRDVFLHSERPLTRTLLLFHADTRKFSVFGAF